MSVRFVDQTVFPSSGGDVRGVQSLADSVRATSAGNQITTRTVHCSVFCDTINEKPVNKGVIFFQHSNFHPPKKYPFPRT